MSPIPHFAQHLSHFLHVSTRSSTIDNLYSPHLTTWIIILAILFALILATALGMTFYIIKTRRFETPQVIVNPDSSEPHKPSISTVVANANWARKDSNILWSAYFTEDDLKSHFSRKPSQMSRMFSIGTMEGDDGSDVCPLERPETLEVKLAGPEVHERVTYAHQITPEKAKSAGTFSPSFPYDLQEANMSGSSWRAASPAESRRLSATEGMRRFHKS